LGKARPCILCDAMDCHTLFDTAPKVVPNGKFPSWLHRKMPEGNALWVTNGVIQENRLHTVCEEAKCPNLLECYSKKTATFLVLGKECTRACGFCDIDFSKKPAVVDEHEPHRVADSIKKLGLKHAVITMVARDDLEDGGALHLRRVIDAIRAECPQVTVEVLSSDLQGSTAALDTVLSARPEIFNHNVETVPSLTSKVRHKATFERSLHVLSYAKQYSRHQLVKSGFMVGLGETKEEVLGVLHHLRDAGCDIVTIGQYLQPSRKKLQVKEFIHPTVFEEYKDAGEKLGIKYVYSGPFVRSSYNAGVVFNNVSITS